MTKPKVTVLLAVYNNVATIDRCLKSIENQTFKDWQISCINDASTDTSAAKLTKWQKKLGSKLTIITNPTNIGLTKSLNKGLKNISTEFTARIDGDDWWHPDKLSKQVAFLNRHPDYGVVGCNYINSSHKGERLIITLESDPVIRQSFLKRNQLAHSCVIFRTNLIKQLGGYNEKMRYSQDYELWLRCLDQTKFYNLQEALCWRSISDQTISVEKQREQMRCGLEAQVSYIKRHRLPLTAYLNTLELWLLILLPEPIKKLKRSLMG